jgi:hypothetical protein
MASLFAGIGCTCCQVDGGAVVTDESGVVASVPVIDETVPVHDETSARMQDAKKENDKVRMQKLFSGFISQAPKGFPCKYLNESTGELCLTKYRIDPKLTTLTIDKGETPADDGSACEVECPLRSIQDIYTFGQDGVGAFPPEIIQKVPPSDVSRLIMVVQKLSDTKSFRFCFLEETVETCNAFLQCMTILRSYVAAAK